MFEELADVVVHVDPEDDTLALPIVALPLRPVIESQVSKCLSELEEDCNLGFSLRPLNLVLHYLNGSFHV